MANNHNMKTKVLYNPGTPSGEGSSGGGGVFAPASQPAASAQPTAQPAVTTPAAAEPASAQPASATPPAAAATPPPSNIVPLSPEQLQQLVTGAVSAAVPRPAPQAPDPREVARLLNVFEMSEEHAAALLAGGPQAVQTFNQVIGPGLVKQAVTIAAMHFQEKMAELEAQYNPVLQHYQTQRQEQMKKDFFTKHPDLTPFEPIAIAAAQQLKASGFSGTQEEAFRLVAENTRKVLTQANIPVGQAGQGAQPTTPPAAQPATPARMPVLSGGGQGGGGSGGAAPAKSAGHAIFS
jgi:hypothetical protein